MRPLSATQSVSVAAAVLCALIGAFIGVCAFTFHTARGASYLSNDPAACLNCHIMREQHDSWQKSSHHAVATCNDCHVPHDFLGKYWTKAEHGARHSWGFTFQNFHEPIQIKTSSLAAVQGNCMRCHTELTREIAYGSAIHSSETTDCVRCHQAVGHGAKR